MTISVRRTIDWAFPADTTSPPLPASGPSRPQAQPAPSVAAMRAAPTPSTVRGRKLIPQPVPTPVFAFAIRRPLPARPGVAS